MYNITYISFGLGFGACVEKKEKQEMEGGGQRSADKQHSRDDF